MVRFYIVNYKTWSHHIVIVVITYMIPDCDIIKHMLSTDASMSEAFPKSRLQCWGYTPILYSLPYTSGHCKFNCPLKEKI